MSQYKKALARLCRKPPPTDFRWDELVTLLEGLGFKLHNGGGSRRHFTAVVNGTPRRINVHEPHPSGIVKPYVIRNVEASLKEWGLA